MTEPDRPAEDAAARLRPFDEALLGLEPDEDRPDRLSFVVVPRLCRTDGRFYGGAAVAAALAASEAVTGRPALWITTQLVASADLDERIAVDVEVLASGRSVDQVQVRGTVGSRLVFNAVGATATGRADGIHGPGQRMPRVPPPEECDGWRGPNRIAMEERFRSMEAPTVGHQLVTQHLDAPFLDADDDHPGRMALWARVGGELAGLAGVTTPAKLGFLADMVPLAVCRAAGVNGAGTSLDNSLRLGEPVDCEWVLLDLDAHIAVGGFGHGRVHVWSPDGQMLATGTQSARLFSIDDFLERRAR